MNNRSRARCPDCGKALKAGTTSVHFERGPVAMTISQVRASTCPRCGTSLINGELASALSAAARRAALNFERILGVGAAQPPTKMRVLRPMQVAFEEEAEGGYHAWAPLLKGCHTFGRTKEEARRKAAEALALWMQSAPELGIGIPETELITPSS